MQLAAIALTGLAVGGVVYVLVHAVHERRAQRRASASPAWRKAQTKAAARAPPRPNPCRCASSRCRTRIKDIEAKQKANKRVTLRTKLLRAGLNDHAAHLLSR